MNEKKLFNRESKLKEKIASKNYKVGGNQISYKLVIFYLKAK